MSSTGSPGAISRRADLLSLTANADTNILPVLWYFAGLPKNDPNPLRDFSTAKLPAAIQRLAKDPEAWVTR